MTERCLVNWGRFNVRELVVRKKLSNRSTLLARVSMFGVLTIDCRKHQCHLPEVVEKNDNNIRAYG